MFLLRIDDLDMLDEQQGEIVVAAREYFSRPLNVFEEFHFLSSSGYGEKLVDEIEVVLSPQYTDSARLMTAVQDAIAAWGLERYANYRTISLSAGWQKYLSLAAFAERLSDDESLLLFQPFHFLDRKRVKTALRNLRRFNAVMVVDLDIPRITTIEPDVVQVALHKGCIGELSKGDRAGINANW